MQGAPYPFPQQGGTAMDLELKGKRAVITGGSVGIGLAVAHALAAEGVEIAIIARDKPRVEAQAAAVAKAHGVRAIGISADVSRKEEIDSAMAARFECL